MAPPTSHLKSNVRLDFGCLFCLVARFGQFRRFPGTPFVITMSDGEGAGSVAAAIWSPLAPCGVHQPRWFQVDLPPSVLEAWSQSTDLEPQRHINKIEAIVPAICLCTWPDPIRGSPWLHFIDNMVPYLVSSLVAPETAHLVLSWTFLGRRYLPWVAGRGSKEYPQNATSSTVCLGRTSPLRLRTIGYVTRRSCLNLF